MHYPIVIRYLPHRKPPAAPPAQGGPDNRLYVVTTVFNPRGYKRRYQLYREFAQRVQHSGCVLYTVEAAFGNKPFVVTQANNPQHIQLRTNDEWFMKENLLNIGFRHLPKSAKHLAWVDADVQFSNPNWVGDTLAMLQKHPVGQMFAHVVNLGPCFQPFQIWNSFGYSLSTGRPPRIVGKDYNHWHPGFCWAFTQDCFEATGGLLERVILGSADTSMAGSWAGLASSTIDGRVSPGFKKYVADWQTKAMAFLKRVHGTVGYVPGSLNHYWHGQLKNRRYVERWQILVDSQFDPITGLVVQPSGLLSLAPGQDKLRAELTAYFAGRDEDSMVFDPSETYVKGAA